MVLIDVVESFEQASDKGGGTRVVFPVTNEEWNAAEEEAFERARRAAEDKGTDAIVHCCDRILGIVQYVCDDPCTIVTRLEMQART